MKNIKIPSLFIVFFLSPYCIAELEYYKFNVESFGGYGSCDTSNSTVYAYRTQITPYSIYHIIDPIPIDPSSCTAGDNVAQEWRNVNSDIRDGQGWADALMYDSNFLIASIIIRNSVFMGTCNDDQLYDSSGCVDTIPDATCESLSLEYPNDGNPDNLMMYEGSPYKETNCVEVVSNLFCSVTTEVSTVRPSDSEIGNTTLGFLTGNSCVTDEEETAFPIDDYTDNSPPACVDSVGSEFCLNEDQELVYYDETLEEHDTQEGQVCIEINGTAACDEPEIFIQDCGYYNGEKGCVNAQGDLIPITSPDHPNNGGNGDGNENNDMLDPDSETGITDPTALKELDLKPVTDAINNQTDDLIESDKLLQKENQDFLKDTFTENFDLDSRIGTIDNSLNGIDSNKAGLSSTYDNMSNFIDDADNGNGHFTQGSIFTNITNYSTLGMGPLLDGGCSDQTINIGVTTFVMKCDNFTELRLIISFVLFFTLVFVTFEMVTDAVKEV